MVRLRSPQASRIKSKYFLQSSTAQVSFLKEVLRGENTLNLIGKTPSKKGENPG